MLLKGILAGALVGSVVVAPVPALGSTGTGTAPQESQAPEALEADAADSAAVKKARKNRIVVKVRGRRLGGKAKIRIRGIKGKAKGVKKTVRVKKRKTVKPLPRGKYKIKAKKITARGRTAQPTPKKQKVRITRKHGAKATIRYRLIKLPSSAPVAAGDGYTCTIVAGGGVKCWGYNDQGQLGDGTEELRLSPVAVKRIQGAVALAAGSEHTCALLATGKIACWGSSRGPLGYGTTPVAVPGITGATAVTAGHDHTCALLHDGTVRCWGINGRGQLGDGTSKQRDKPVAARGITTATTVAAGGGHTCAVLDNGRVKCWGANWAGQLGDGITTKAKKRTPVGVAGITNAEAVTAGAAHTCALLADDTVRCWGNNDEGQLGDGTTTTRRTPVAVAGVVNAALVSAGSLGIWGGYTCAGLADGTARCWGDNRFGQLGNGVATDQPQLAPAAVSDITTLTALDAGPEHTCALLDDSTVRCWGSNGTGQLGDGTTTSRPAPVAVPGTVAAVAVTSGSEHGCALLGDGTVTCWGANLLGQLGDGTTTSRFTPAVVAGLPGAAAVDAGGANTCALLANGTVRCWGANEYGQLGSNVQRPGRTPAYWPEPLLVPGIRNAKAISVGSFHICALMADGTIKCWGLNDEGQLGDGTRTNRATPAAVVGIADATAIAVGRHHTCALLTNGTIKCWGLNDEGQLGDGTRTNRATPAAVVGITGATTVAADADHTCAVLGDGTVRCWGSNEYKQLGDGTTTDRYTPVGVTGVTDAIAVAVAASHSCALLGTGTVKCWGSNTFGQLGDGNRTPRPIGFEAVTVSGIGDATSIAAGGAAGADAWRGSHTCALLDDRTLRCWGSNASGQLGVNPGWLPVDVEGL